MAKQSPQARIHWMQNLAHELGGDQKAHDMISGKGVSLILADVSIKFRRPITYPDAVSHIGTSWLIRSWALPILQLLIAHRPHDPFPTHFSCAAAIWSNAQRAVVATSESKLVWYDIDFPSLLVFGADIWVIGMITTGWRNAIRVLKHMPCLQSAFGRDHLLQLQAIAHYTTSFTKPFDSPDIKANAPNFQNIVIGI